MDSCFRDLADIDSMACVRPAKCITSESVSEMCVHEYSWPRGNIEFLNYAGWHSLTMGTRFELRNSIVFGASR